MSIFSFGKSEKPQENNVEASPSKEEAKTTSSTLPAFPQKVLVVLDGTHLAYRGLEEMIHFSQVTNCQVYAVFVIDSASIDMLMQMNIFVGEERDIFEHEMETKAAHTLDYASKIASKNNVDLQTAVIRGRVHQEIIKASKELDVDLLVIPGGKHSLTRKDASSVEIQLLLDQTQLPVLVMKERQ